MAHRRLSARRGLIAATTPAAVAAAVPPSPAATAAVASAPGKWPHGRPVDGVQSAADCSAIRDFQAARGLARADGYADPGTYRTASLCRPALDIDDEAYVWGTKPGTGDRTPGSGEKGGAPTEGGRLGSGR
ncbi:hypothetical protein [Kitasatospora sp. NPDC085879]|uniref:peptidoglycan-binding domain-containing protein n=1 Tax=Kitasatospora sp. NPDC085879 TaxID=3154769 RepID=UPI003433248A